MAKNPEFNNKNETPCRFHTIQGGFIFIIKFWILGHFEKRGAVQGRKGGTKPPHTPLPLFRVRESRHSAREAMQAKHVLCATPYVYRRHGKKHGAVLARLMVLLPSWTWHRSRWCFTCFVTALAFPHANLKHVKHASNRLHTIITLGSARGTAAC